MEDVEAVEVEMVEVDGVVVVVVAAADVEEDRQLSCRPRPR